MTLRLPMLGRRSLLGAAALPLLSQAGHAQAWPTRPVRVVIPYPPGGGTDAMARITAQHLTQRLGQPFVADNRAGANGQLAAEYVARTAPDGYTLLFCGNTQTAILPHLQPVQYDPAKDFVPVSIVGMNSAIFAVHPSVPANTLEELVALIRAEPGKYNYGSPGRGTITQLTAALWLHRLGLNIEHVPFRGGAQSLTEAISGRVQMLTGVPGDLLPASLAGQLRPLAVASAERMPQLPNVPTVSESMPGFVVLNWNGYVAPTGTPQPIIDRLAREIGEIVRMPDVAQRLVMLGNTPVGNSPAEMAAVMQAEAPVLRDAAQSPGVQDS
ncbi:Bug family tripartite tricarboxylate transporter substrate binding protein [Humitalea sp. 24SJ18S-53]|uniref:Bug family tripartite tricarboxylate transporter substrate binding protein n=1 Tax=Humitalea sp. 24SJ18S-53 TaxID=3422307 RepID=UPI003D6694C7